MTWIGPSPLSLGYHGMLEPVPGTNGGVHLEYVLTEKGRARYLVLVALRQLGSATVPARARWDSG